MNKEQILGQVRELLTAGGAVLAVYGLHYGHQWEPVIGVLVLGIALAWGLYQKEGWDSIYSTVRKLANTAGSAAVTYGILAENQAAALLGLVGPALALLGSWRSNGAEESRSAPLLYRTLVATGTALGLATGGGLTSGCAALGDATLVPIVDDWGCLGARVRSGSEAGGHEYAVAYCPDGRATVTWSSAWGLEFRAVLRAKQRVEIYYRPRGGEGLEWLRFDEKAGVLPPETPTPVLDALGA